MIARAAVALPGEAAVSRASRSGAAPEVPSFLGAGDFTYRASPVPVFASARGSRLIDLDGRVYIDAEAANGSAMLGYDPTILADAGEFYGGLPALPSFCESTLRLDVAERLQRRISDAVGAPGRVTFELGGTQGIELAMKIVAANRGWDQIVTLQGGYHGRSPFASHLSASPRYRSGPRTSIGEVVRLPLPDCERCPFSAELRSCADGCARLAATLGSDHSGVLRENVSALVIEPLLNVAGMVLPSSAYIEAAVQPFQDAGALLVVDEVFTGFHRTGPEFGFQLHHLRPDIVVLSKALTNGVGALSAVWAREPLLDAAHFAPGTHSSTFAGSPLMLSLASIVLDRLADRERWLTRTAQLQAQLAALVECLASSFPGTVRSGYAQGAVARLLLERPVAAQIRQQALRGGEPVNGVSGVLVASTGMAPDVIALHPPLTIEDDELETTGAILHAAIERVCAA